MSRAVHPSIQTAHEYTGKAPEITSKLTSLWESKVKQDGKLPESFNKDPHPIASAKGVPPPRGPSLKFMGSRNSSKNESESRSDMKSSNQADAGPPLLAKKLSVVEIKSVFEKDVAEGSKEIEKTLSQSKESDQKDENSQTPELTKILNTLEAQLKELNESIEYLKKNLNL